MNTKYILKWLGVLLFLYIGWCTTLYFIQEKFIFFPFSEYAQYPTPNELKWEEVTFPTEDGETLHGFWMNNGDPQTILFFHGNGGNISHRLGQLFLFQKLGLNALMMDYRGYGKSTGEIDSEEDLYRDGSASLKFLIEEKKVPLQNIIFWGESLGTSVATFLAQEVDTKALILEAPFASFTDVVRYHYPFLPVNWMLKYALDNKKRMDDIHIPVLILHSTEDDIIPFSQGQELFEAASEPKTLVELSGGHNDALSHSTEKYFKAVQEFLQ